MVESLFISLSISFAIQIVFFTFAFLFKTDKTTDLSYGFTFIIIAFLFLVRSSFELNQIIISILIIIWGIRIAAYLFIRILKTGRDKRFDKFRHSFFKFGGFWFLQALSVWIIMLPSVIVLSSKENIGVNFFTFFGIAIWMLGFGIEAVSDQQKYIFKSKNQNSDKWISSGLWKYSRHPNYFGEILVWLGIFIFAIPYLSNFLWISIISPIFITSLLVFVSGIPPLEKRYDEKYKENKNYQEYKKKTNILFPLPRFS